MRESEHGVDAQFTARWSRRAYDPSQRLTAAELATLFEAARWAPSSSNEQPWRFYYPQSEGSRPMFDEFVNENNRSWAHFAGHIIIVCARKTFAVSGKPNPHAWYDTGAAVLSLIQQAEKMGFHARQMAGILSEVIAEKLGIDSAIEDIICAVALGKPGDVAQLQERHRALEVPSGRKAVSEFVVAV